ncbi:acyltransferase family protein [Nocardioides sp. 503]|uniref:acyltransferase family protein n=1 Tax=Nocardioides sp. 503 TaxID=2508326 RepID=UPI001FD6B627|nr:acyltransferase family protein [Nocardioides sp. 503]
MTETRVPPRAPSRSFRPDIEGLRAVAVLSVLIYHANLAWVPGGYVGVDIFFVISGFLITSLMVRQVERQGRLGLADFWARRARRLLPASTLVLVFSAVVALVCLPVNTRKDFGGDIVSAALYVVNWRLGAREVDYLAENVGASPVQHYWSLAVEEQFYIVWPLLIAALVALFRTRWRPALLVGITAVTVASFVFTLSYTVAQPDLAFFVSTTRIWELGVGALLAIAFPVLVRLPAALRGALGWVGLAAVCYSVLQLDDATVWPGTATLLPVLGTAAAILAGGGAAPRWGVGLVLGLRPAVWIGGLSYSLYLWHWPFLIAAEGLWGDLRVRQALLVVLASAIPAWLSYRYVETPFRHAPRFALPRPALLAGAAGMAVSIVAGFALVASFGLVDTVEEATAEEAPGALALNDPRFADTDWAALKTVDVLRPSPLDAYADYPSINRDGCVASMIEEDFKPCEYGDPDAERTVALVGDSKAAQWFPPIRAIAEKEGWRLVVMFKNGCPFAASRVLVNGQPSPSCASWQPWAMEQLEELRPDVLLTVTRNSRALPPGGTTEDDARPEPMVEGLVEYWQRLVDAGIMLVPILDTPIPVSKTVPDCVQDHLDDLTQCVSLKKKGTPRSGAPAQLAAAEQVPEARIVDMSPVVCPDGVHCPPVIGNVLVYRGGTHLSNTYAKTTTTILAEKLAEATGGLFGSAAPASG